jgi:hypothetical protein
LTILHFTEAAKKYYNFLVDSWKIISNGFMYCYNMDLANQISETYENNYKKFLENYEDWYKKQH